MKNILELVKKNLQKYGIQDVHKVMSNFILDDSQCNIMAKSTYKYW